MNYFAIFKYLVLCFYAAAYVCQVSAECDNNWLERYEGVLKTINKRPGFPAPLTEAFKKSHFKRVGSAGGLHLAHVMSYYDIRCKLDELFEEAYDVEKISSESKNENYNPIRNFINKLFERDDEAVVNFGGWYPPLTWEGWVNRTAPWYEQTSFRQFDTDYLDVKLENLLNTYLDDILDFLDRGNRDHHINFWKETHEEDPNEVTNIKEENAKAIKDIFLWANGAPSNLRYGDGSSNSAIQENFDPMGNEHGTITTKESEMLKNYVVNYKVEVIEGEYYLRSSTGLHKKKVGSSTKWYVKCLQDNKKCF